jgi:hypothetical protein
MLDMSIHLVWIPSVQSIQDSNMWLLTVLERRVLEIFMLHTTKKLLNTRAQVLWQVTEEA